MSGSKYVEAPDERRISFMEIVVTGGFWLLVAFVAYSCWTAPVEPSRRSKVDCRVEDCEPADNSGYSPFYGR